MAGGGKVWPGKSGAIREFCPANPPLQHCSIYRVASARIHAAQTHSSLHTLRASSFSALTAWFCVQQSIVDGLRSLRHSSRLQVRDVAKPFRLPGRHEPIQQRAAPHFLQCSQQGCVQPIARCWVACVTPSCPPPPAAAARAAAAMTC
jgi:hypothetical protein